MQVILCSLIDSAYVVVRGDKYQLTSLALIIGALGVFKIATDIVAIT